MTACPYCDSELELKREAVGTIPCISMICERCRLKFLKDPHYIAEQLGTSCKKGRHAFVLVEEDSASITYECVKCGCVIVCWKKPSGPMKVLKI